MVYDGGSDDVLIEIVNVIPIGHGFLKVKLRCVHKRLKFAFAHEKFKYYMIKKEVFESWKELA